MIIVPTTYLSFRRIGRGGAVLMDVVRASGTPAILGVAAGSAVAAFAPGAVLKIAFVMVASAISTKLLLGRDACELGMSCPVVAA